MEKLPPHVATADEPLPSLGARPWDGPDLHQATPLPIMLAELAHLYDDDVGYLDQLLEFVAEAGCNLLAHYCRDGELVLTAGGPCDAQTRHRNRWMHYLIADLRKAEGREELLLRRLVEANRCWDERPANPRETTRVVRDWLKSGGRLLINPQGKLEEGGGIPSAFIQGTPDEAAECERAGRTYFALRHRYRADRQIKRAVRMLQKPLAADFIAYAHAPAATCVLLPVPALQRAWRQHGRQWIGLYGQRRAQNPGYTSVSVPVPRGVLMQAIVEAMFVS